MSKSDIGILYDVQRDGTLEAGEAILIYENGSREKIGRGEFKRLFRTRGEGNATNQAGRRPITQRSRVSTRVKRSQSNTRQSKVAKEISISSIDHKRQNISPKRHSEMAGVARKGIITT